MEGKRPRGQFKVSVSVSVSDRDMGRVRVRIRGLFELDKTGGMRFHFAAHLLCLGSDLRLPAGISGAP